MARTFGSLDQRLVVEPRIHLSARFVGDALSVGLGIGQDALSLTGDALAHLKLIGYGFPHLLQNLAEGGFIDQGLAAWHVDGALQQVFQFVDQAFEIHDSPPPMLVAR